MWADVRSIRGGGRTTDGAASAPGNAAPSGVSLTSLMGFYPRQQFLEVHPGFPAFRATSEAAAVPGFEGSGF